MIKFFRKIRQSLLVEGKTGTYIKYALGEIILVVIGILIALQLNNWNEKRVLERETYTILNSLRSEMLSNKTDLEEVLLDHNQNLEAGKEILTFFGDPVSPTHDDHLFELFNLFGGNYTFDPSTGVLKTSIATGLIANINNEELKSLLTGFEDQTYDTNESTIEFREVRNSHFRPILYKYLGMTEAYSYRYEIMPKSKFPHQFNELFMNQELESLTANLVVLRKEAIDEEVELMGTIDRIVALLDEEITSNAFHTP